MLPYDNTFAYTKYNADLILQDDLTTCRKGYEIYFKVYSHIFSSKINY